MANQEKIYTEINQLEIPRFLHSLWQKLSIFVEDMCIHRDESHGFLHMQQVAKTSLYISGVDYPQLPEHMVCILVISAWLHDVADSKYDQDGDLKNALSNFLHGLIPEYKDVILRIIKYVSFSHEKRKQITDWNKVFPIPELLAIRHIVSDADKLDTLGAKGISRIMGYARHIGSDEREHLRLIRNNRISVLKEYIRTNTGKQLAEVMHAEFEHIFNLNFL